MRRVASRASEAVSSCAVTAWRASPSGASTASTPGAAAKSSGGGDAAAAIAPAPPAPAHAAASAAAEGAAVEHRRTTYGVQSSRPASWMFESLRRRLPSRRAGLTCHLSPLLMALTGACSAFRPLRTRARLRASRAALAYSGPPPPPAAPPAPPRAPRLPAVLDVGAFVSDRQRADPRFLQKIGIEVGVDSACTAAAELVARGAAAFGAEWVYVVDDLVTTVLLVRAAVAAAARVPAKGCAARLCATRAPRRAPDARARAARMWPWCPSSRRPPQKTRREAAARKRPRPQPRRTRQRRAGPSPRQQTLLPHRPRHLARPAQRWLRRGFPAWEARGCGRRPSSRPLRLRR